MANFVYIAVSLDGYIATEDGGVEWLDSIPHPDDYDYGYAEFMSGIDALLMGRHSFEKVLSFNQWPYEKPVFVLSTHLSEVPDDLRDRAQIVTGEIPGVVDRLASRGYRNLYVDGGQLISSFLREDLIDEMIISTIPIILGGGIPLFGKIPNPLAFTLVESKSFSNSLLMNHYRRAK